MDRKIVQKVSELRNMLQESSSEEGDESRQYMLGIVDEIIDFVDAGHGSQDSIYQSIIHKLAQEYFRIFYVNIWTDDYMAYDPFDPHAEFDVDHIEHDFFLQSSRGMFDTLYEEDAESFFSGFRKDKVLQSIADHGEFSLIYRVKHQGGYFFANMKGTKLENDPDHIIVGVKNIDADVRREKEYLINLKQAKDEANHDGLTGIRNRHAYLEYIAHFEQKIESGEISQFAVIIFDVNGLKAINDTLGHQAGDRLIKEACTIICNIFKRSPVFRIGGDEFIAIARGEDYVNLDHLLDQLEYLNIQHLAHGGIVIAAGAAKAEGKGDIKKIIDQADAEMYANKKRLKNR